MAAPGWSPSSRNADPTLHRAIAAGGARGRRGVGLTADSLGARRIGDLGFAAARAEAPVSVLVTDEDVAAARALLWRGLPDRVRARCRDRVAGLLSGAYVPADGERVAVIVCGANTDPATLA